VSASLRVHDDVRLKVRSAAQDRGPRISLQRSDEHREHSALLSRLEQARGGLSFRELAELTGTNQESVRRYHRFGQPSFEYVLRFCEALEISPNWLLLGKGVAPLGDPLNKLLVEASAPELLHALGNVFQKQG
jgi:hypothetical protein